MEEKCIRRSFANYNRRQYYQVDKIWEDETEGIWHAYEGWGYMNGLGGDTFWETWVWRGGRY